MRENTKVVTDFIDAWRRNDVDEIMEFFAADCVYHNIPIAPAKGLEQIRGMIQAFSGIASKVEWVVHQIAENDAGVVLTERTDRFEIGGNWLELPVMGVFELRGGKLTAWRDYFDMGMWQRQLPKQGS